MLREEIEEVKEIARRIAKEEIALAQTAPEPVKEAAPEKATEREVGRNDYL